VDDVAVAVAHARARVGEWGGDTTRIFLMGHSAGAQIAALVAYDERYLARQGLTPRIFAGFIGLSGPYDFVLDSKLLRATFGGEVEREHDAQPVNFVRRDVPRTLLAMGRDDKTVRPRNTTSLVARLHEAGASVEAVWVPGDHGVTVGAFARTNRGESEVLKRIRAFVNEHFPDVQVHEEHGLAPFKGHVTGPYAEAIKDAYKFAFNASCSFTREGGSIGAVKTMEDVLGCDVFFLGLSLPSHGYHAPNENYDWEQASGGMAAFAHYFQAVSGIKN